MIVKRNSEAIFKLVQTGDIDKINQAIKDGSLDITERLSLDNVTIWHLLAEGKSEKHSTALATLLKRYAHYLYNNAQVLNQKDTNGLTPILCAADVGNMQAIRLLVAFGADPTIAADNNHPEFLLYGKRDAIKLLKLQKYHNLIPEMETIIREQEQLRATVDWNNLLLEQERAEEQKEQAGLQIVLTNRTKPSSPNAHQKGIYHQLKTLFCNCYAKPSSGVGSPSDEYSLSKKLRQ